MKIKGRKKIIGKSDGMEISTINPKKYFNNLLKHSKKAREGYFEGYMEDLVYRLKQEMLKKHLSQYALAKKAGLKYQVVSRILQGAPNAEVSTLSKMADIVDLRLVFAKR